MHNHSQASAVIIFDFTWKNKKREKVLENEKRKSYPLITNYDHFNIIFTNFWPTLLSYMKSDVTKVNDTMTIIISETFASLHT